MLSSNSTKTIILTTGKNNSLTLVRETLPGCQRVIAALSQGDRTPLYSTNNPNIILQVHQKSKIEMYNGLNLSKELVDILYHDPEAKDAPTKLSFCLNTLKVWLYESNRFNLSPEEIVLFKKIAQELISKEYNLDHLMPWQTLDLFAVFLEHDLISAEKMYEFLKTFDSNFPHIEQKSIDQKQDDSRNTERGLKFVGAIKTHLQKNKNEALKQRLQELFLLNKASLNSGYMNYLDKLFPSPALPANPEKDTTSRPRATSS